MKTKLMAYCVAMDENGTLWIATRGPRIVGKCAPREALPQMWERMPLCGCAALRYEPLNALLVGRVLRPDFAVDAYIMTSSQVESLEKLAAA
jgi:hypothetical protein